MKRFELDAEQTDAILELKIYRLARLEILIIRKELEEKRRRDPEHQRAAEGRAGPLGRRARRDRGDAEEVRRRAPYGDASDEGEAEYTAEDFIVDEDNVVLVSRDGWVKRQKEVKDVSTTRVREGDTVLAVLPGSTRATVVFFSNFGVAYSARIADFPASTGYGEPIQRFFKLRDGEADRRGAQPGSARERDDRGEEGRRRAARPCARRDERRLQPALQPGAVRRAQHARRAAIRADAGRRGGRRRRAV